MRARDDTRHLPQLIVIVGIRSVRRELERRPAKSVVIGDNEKDIIMKLATIGLAAALALTTSGMAFAQATGSATGGSATGGAGVSGTGTGSSMGTTTTGSATGTTGSASSSMGNSAGSSAAGANSTYNPSGNSYINSSPSGSTLAPQSGTAPR